MEHLRRKLLYEFYKLLDLAILVCVLAFVILFFSETPKELASSDVLAFFSFKNKIHKRDSASHACGRSKSFYKSNRNSNHGEK